jgi:tetratricopeptide (TPR) repeat protein
MFRDRFEIIKPHIIPFLFLFGMTLALYWQALGHNFLIFWDDNGYVTNNMTIRRISWENIRTIFTSIHMGNYAPVQILSYMFDYLIWGMRPGGYIFTNILIHAANGILFYYLLTKLSWHRLTACTAVLIFLIHPVQVESVVWISERKNILSMLFFLLSFISYVSYRVGSEKRRGLLYASSIIAFVLSLLAKSVSIILPFVLISFDLCMVERRDRKNLKKLFVDKIPFIAIAFVFAVITVKSQARNLGGGLTSHLNGNPFVTLFTMLPVFVQYLKLIFWPVNLSAVYAPAIKTGIDIEVAFAALLLSLVMVLGIFLWHRRRDLLFWLLLFFIGLLPVSQIVPIVTLMNDRYLYFPMLGAAAFIVSVTSLAIDKAQKRGSLVGTAACIIFLLQLIGHSLLASYERIPVWKNEFVLWEDAVRKVPDSPKARFSYAHILEYQGKFDEAERQYEIGLRLSPEPFERYSLANLYEKNGHPDKAREEYLRFLTQAPAFLDARHSLALLYFKEGTFDKAIEQYKIALQYYPDWARGYHDLGVIYAEKGDRDEAIRNSEKAISLDPGNAEFHYAFGIVLVKNGLKEKALREFETATHLDPGKPLYAIKFLELSEMLEGKVRE